MRLVIQASRDSQPAPTSSKNSEASSIEKSVRPSWAIFQNPLLRRIGIFVVPMATSMIVIVGITAGRVQQSQDDADSAHDFKAADERGENLRLRQADLGKTPVPTSPGNKNFCIPSDRKTIPTIRRIRTTAAGARLQEFQEHRPLRLQADRLLAVSAEVTRAKSHAG